jgi:four helix bundle protein
VRLRQFEVRLRQFEVRRRQFEVLIALIAIIAGVARFPWWHCADCLDRFIVALTGRPAVARHRDFCGQILRASGSVTDNISEGFGRYYPKEFHRYVQIARGELNETRNHLMRGLRSGYITQAEFDEGIELWGHAIRTTAGLQRYLLSCIPPSQRPRHPTKPQRRRGR